MNIEEQIYLSKLKEIIEDGIDSDDRTGVGTKYLFSQKFDYDISNGRIPIWTTRKVPWRNQVLELIWFIRGDTNIKFLKDNNVNIWDHWADPKGSVGPIYGKQLRNWETIIDDKVGGYFGVTESIVTIDQLQILIDNIKTNPESRRHIITLWNAGIHNTLQKPYLPPCHSQHIQIVINEKKKELYYQMLQRSADMPLGYAPHQHALFANIIGKLTGYHATKMSIIVSNCHVYNNQIDKVKEQIVRVPTEFPTLKINKELLTLKDVEDSCLEDYELIGYNPQPFIKFPIAV